MHRIGSPSASGRPTEANLEPERTMPATTRQTAKQAARDAVATTSDAIAAEFAARMLTYRGEFRCFSCGRYLGEFESHPKAHGPNDVHFLPADGGQTVQRPLQTERGLRCPACEGRVVASEVDRFAA